MIKTIVLAGDRNYIRQLETTIKSILYHNRDVKIYILNQDIMPDWFRKPRKIARMLGSEIIDVKLPEQTVFQDWEKQDHISSITYARYFIADYIQEDTVLYLDSDLIVNTSLEKLFSICLEEKSLAAVKDTDGITFNTGVLLINNEKWRQEKLKERLIEQSIVTMKEVEEGRFEHFNGDQTIFNQVLQDDWLELGRAYNLQVGHDIVALYNNWQEHLAFNDKPVVIHFTTYRKPWTTLTANRYRDLWWEFHDLEWNQILQHHLGEFELISPLDKEFSCLTLTNSQDLEGIEELVTALPEVVFHIAAWTDMGDKLKKLAVYNNVRLHPQIVPPVLDKLKKSTNLYLDINHGSADENFLKSLQEQEKTLLAFQSTQHGELANQLKHIVGLESDEKLVVCLPDAFDDRFVFTWWATPFWKEHMNVYMDFYKELCKGSWYGSTFISRPYIDYEDKSKAKGQFEKLKSIWENRDILIVEGITSRSGVGNDLFDKVKSVKRIICPSHNAYSVVDNIQEEIMKHAEGRLILCMLGPTAKVLSYNLCQMGYQVLDVGHIDSEYEWMKMGAKTKVKFSHKHTAEHNFDQDIEFIDDETYNSQILVDLSKREV
ncbi:glycosyltransferase [Streptococcus pneumoniae]|nr:glycosyltransferase [Streptococcus pneumoniae]